jgi:hypothetical protein
MAETPSVGNDVQRCENKRKNSFLNYKSLGLQKSPRGISLVNPAERKKVKQEPK